MFVFSIGDLLDIIFGLIGILVLIICFVLKKVIDAGREVQDKKWVAFGKCDEDINRKNRTFVVGRWVNIEQSEIETKKEAETESE